MPRKRKRTALDVFGENVATARRAAELSQADLGRRLGGGMTNPYISKVENGHANLTITQADRFAAALGLPLFHLFDPKGLGDA